MVYEKQDRPAQKIRGKVRLVSKGMNPSPPSFKTSYADLYQSYNMESTVDRWT